MSRFIYNVRFISNKKMIENAIEYYATREGVELYYDGEETASASASSPDDVKQTADIDELLTMYPDSKLMPEYDDFVQDPSPKNKAALISMIVDRNLADFFDVEKYLGYIAYRPRAEAVSHTAGGLFTSGSAPLSMAAIQQEAANRNGGFYTTVLSLRREDAARLGYENAMAWKRVIEKNIHKVAENFKIPIEDLRWYASFHNESHHPHCHMFLYSVGHAPYLTEKGIENIKAAFVHDLFRDELHEAYTQEQDMLAKIRSAIAAETAAKLRQAAPEKSLFSDRTVQELLAKKLQVLSAALKKCKGRAVYGYLPPNVKSMVDDIMDTLAKAPDISEAYDRFLSQQDQINLLYHSVQTLPPHPRLSEQRSKAFRAIKNLIVSSAASLESPEKSNFYPTWAEVKTESESEEGEADSAPEVLAAQEKAEEPLKKDPAAELAGRLVVNVLGVLGSMRGAMPKSMQHAESKHDIKVRLILC